MLETFLRIELHPLQQDLLWFEQDGATVHTVEISMHVLRKMSPCRLIARFGDITWPARSPDHAVPDYFLWGYAESNVYETRAANIADLQHRILECIQGISKEMLQRVIKAFSTATAEVY